MDENVHNMDENVYNMDENNGANNAEPEDEDEVIIPNSGD